MKCPKCGTECADGVRFLDKITFTSDTLRKYFPRSYTPARMQETIIKLLEAWQRKRQRDQER